MAHANPFPLTVLVAVLVPWLIALPIGIAIWRRRAPSADLPRLRSRDRPHRSDADQG